MSRQAFEAHILRTTPTAELDMNNGEYIVQAIQYQWLGWQACRKELSEKEPVCFISVSEELRISFWKHLQANVWGFSSKEHPIALIIRPTEE